MSEQDERQEPQQQDQPDDEAQPAVEPTETDQGEYEQDAIRASAGDFNPDQPVRTSAPPPESQSGVPGLAENEGVEAQEQYKGPVVPGEDRPQEERGPADQTTHPSEPTE